MYNRTDFLSGRTDLLSGRTDLLSGRTDLLSGAAFQRLPGNPYFTRVFSIFEG